MANDTQKPLVFNDWSNGMADSPNFGVGLLQNVSIDTVPGALMPQYAAQKLNHTPSSSTFTWDHTTNTGTIGGSFPALTTGIAVTLSNSGGALPTGLSAATTYYIIKTGTTTFQLASTLHNAITSPTAITTSDNGSGTQTMTTIDLGTVNHMIQNPISGYIFCLDSNGRLWFLENGTQLFLAAGQTLTNAAGNGMCGFTVSDASAFYVFVFRNSVIDVLNASGNTQLEDPVGSSAWTTGWQNTNTGSNPHYAILGQDNIVYFCDGRYVGSILEKAGSVFAPSTGATYTYNNQALKLPSGEVAAWLEQLGINLLVAGGTYNYVYPWDRSSASFTFPWICPENNILRLKNIGNTIYILAGLRGNVYKSQGYSVVLARKLPEWVTQSTSQTQVGWGGIASRNGSLVFGADNLGSVGIGSWSLQPDLTSPFMYGTGGKLTLDNQLVNGSKVTAILVTAVQGQTLSQEFYYFGGVGELSLVSNSRYNTLSTCLYQSGLRSVGNKISKAKYSRLELNLNQPGSVGNQVRVSWRAQSSGSWTVLATFTADGSANTFTQDIGLHDLENVQVQVEVKGSASGSSALEVLSVIMYP